MKDTILKYLGIAGFVVAVWVLFFGPWHISSNGATKFGASAAGGLLAENYIPYVLYNAGYNSAKDLTISGGTTLSGANLFSGATSLGTNGTALNRLNSGTCNIKSQITTIAASSSIAIDCGGGALGATALAGVTAADKVLLQQSTTTPSVAANAGTGLTVLGASASSTAGFITAILFNGTGGTFTWTAAASSSWQYWIAN